MDADFRELDKAKKFAMLDGQLIVGLLSSLELKVEPLVFNGQLVDFRFDGREVFHGRLSLERLRERSMEERRMAPDSSGGQETWRL